MDRQTVLFDETITYHGKDIETMTREELITAFKDVAAQVALIAEKAVALVAESKQ